MKDYETKQSMHNEVAPNGRMREDGFDLAPTSARDIDVVDHSLDATKASPLTAALVTFLISVLSLIAASPLLVSGWYRSHEGTTIIERVIAVAYEINGGNWYPRWLSLGSYGKGEPFLNYYAPGFYLAAGYLKALGLPILIAVKTTCISLFFAGGMGMYLWLKGRYGIFGAIIAAVLYLFAPYHFVNIYVRGAMAEFAALAFFPFLFYGIDLTFCASRFRTGVTVTGLATAFIILTHNLSALMIAPFALAYFVRMAFIAKPSVRQLIGAISAPIAGVGITAFYWLPVLLERDYLGNFSSKMTSGYYDIENNFVTPVDWVVTKWGFKGSVEIDHLSYQVGTVLFIFFAAALLKSSMGKGNGERGFTLFVATLGILALLLTTHFSSPFYNFISPFRFVQFPWRFLGVAGLFLSATTGILRPTPGAVGYRTKLGLGIGITISLCILSSAGQRVVSTNLTNDYDRFYRDAANKNVPLGALTVLNDYLPRWVDNEEIVEELLTDVPFAPTTRIDKLWTGASRMTFSAESPQNNNVVIVPWFYFPGFTLQVDQKKWEVKPGINGFMTFELPTGTHQVELTFGTTPARVAGWCISAIIFFGMLAWRIAPINHYKTTRG
ncbi:MAG: 6-pyruvoyl-tetrahydropterin synthase-related protein [Desulfobulbaceae bacterium]|nr:6-pyruvoyl-tetrahydropterin synthase-related protein [Desulfobulbaceae bacterium]